MWMKVKPLAPQVSRGNPLWGGTRSLDAVPPMDRIRRALASKPSGAILLGWVRCGAHWLIDIQAGLHRLDSTIIAGAGKLVKEVMQLFPLTASLW